jgi:hypothetical protein
MVADSVPAKMRKTVRTTAANFPFPRIKELQLYDNSALSKYALPLAWNFHTVAEAGRSTD